MPSPFDAGGPPVTSKGCTVSSSDRVFVPFPVPDSGVSVPVCAVPFQDGRVLGLTGGVVPLASPTTS